MIINFLVRFFKDMSLDETKREMQKIAMLTGKELIDESINFFLQFPYTDYNLDIQNLDRLDRLEKLKELDPSSYTKLHKGGQFYFLGMRAYKDHNFQSAAYYFDAALSEDIKNVFIAGEKTPFVDSATTPAVSYLTLNTEDQEQAAIEQVREITRLIENGIAYYSSITSSNITLGNIQDNFLKRSVTLSYEDMSNNQRKNKSSNSWRSIITAFITFLPEWKYYERLLQMRAEEGTMEPFYLHLFKGTLIFESLLKSSPLLAQQFPGEKITKIRKETLGSLFSDREQKKKKVNECRLWLRHCDQKKEEVNECRSLLWQRLSLTHSINTSAPFEKILGDVGKVKNITDAIQLTIQIRNTTGHNLNLYGKLYAEKYSKMVKFIFSSCLHLISNLYNENGNENDF